MQILIQKDNHLEMERNSWPRQGKTFSSMRIWHCPVKPFTFCDQWGETRRVNSCRNFSCIKFKYFQLYIVGEMLFFLLLRNYLHVRARWVEGLWFFFLNLICLLNFIMVTVSGCDIILFGLDERRKKNIPVPFLCALSVPQCFFVLGMLLSLTYTL